MFGFTARKAQQDLQQFLVRMINCKSKARAMVADNRRFESRTRVNLGLWVVPLSDGSPDADAAFSAVTADMSSTGIALLTERQIETEEVLLVVPWEPRPRLIRADVCNCCELGCGWTIFNLKAVELLDEGKYADLLQLDQVTA